ncbi:hypothetical protein M758_1G221800 [Ceratodon purpureus]|nr:hypothetical protein M758_1G221800 [Ceratodon purpureus]
MGLVWSRIFALSEGVGNLELNWCFSWRRSEIILCLVDLSERKLRFL